MKNYLVYWAQPNGCGDSHLMNEYAADGQEVNKAGAGVFSTSREDIARRVYDSELAYAESAIPKLSSFSWGGMGCPMTTRPGGTFGNSCWSVPN